MRSALATSAALLLLATLTACGEEDADTPATGAGSATTVTCDYPTDGTPAAKDVSPPPAEAPKRGDVPVTITTSAGEIDATLDSDAAPCTVNNFVSLAEQGWFDDSQCHRLTTSGIFVLQCGDPTATGTGGPGYTIADEVTGDETYPAGTIAMAKTASPDSGGSQFFLVYEDTPLPADYTVFGEVGPDGLAVLRDVAAKGAVGGAPDGAPAEDVVIEGVAVE